jgi:hypothetical protein
MNETNKAPAPKVLPRLSFDVP